MTGAAPQDLAENDQLDPCGGRDATSSRRPVLVASTRAWTGTMIAGMGSGAVRAVKHATSMAVCARRLALS